MNSDRIWRLPGPAEFLEQLIPDLVVGDGLVVLEAPSTFELDSLVEVVSTRDPDLRAELLDDALIGELGLCRAIGDALGVLEPDPTSVDWVSDALDYGRLALFVHVSGIRTAADRDFLRKVTRANRTSEPLALVMTLHDDGSETAFEVSGIPHRIHRWWGVVSKLDAFVAAALHAPESSEVIRASAVEVGAPDLTLVERLIDADSRDPDEVLTICADRASELDLAPMSVRSGHAADRPSKGDRTGWQRGGIQSMDGLIRAHAGVLGKPRILRRLWAGQVASLLPRIDLARLEIIDAISGADLVAPIDHDTEIGELCHILFKSRSRSDLREAALWLKNARNLLSHLEVISDESLRHGEKVMRDAGLAF